MNDNDSRPGPKAGSKATPAPDGSADNEYGDGRREPVFTEFDEDYEEAERDTDYASAYSEDEPEDDDYLDSQEDDDADDRSAAWQVLAAGGSGNAGTIAREKAGWTHDTEQDSSGTDVDESAEEPESELFDDDYEDDEEDEEYPEDDDSDENWDDEDAPGNDSWQDDETTSQSAHRFPLTLVIVGLVALGLLAIGGYGVIQQRSAADEEIRRLQAALATASSPVDVAATREKLREMEIQTEKHLANIEVLTLYNKQLTDTVAGLEKQLAAQQSLAPAGSVSAKTAPARPAAAPAAAPRTAQKAPGAAAAIPTAAGDWFVNFSSYKLRGPAESWAKKLKPSAGKVIVTPFDKDGGTFYRVRVVGLADRAQATKVAEQLRSDHDMPPLWVGTE